MKIIDSIKIINYRSCIDTSFELNDNLTALIGANGAGKTNILNTFSILGSISGERSFYRPVLEKNNIDSSIISASIQLNNKKYDLRFEFYLDFDEYSENVRLIKLDYKRLPLPSWTVIDERDLQYANYYLTEKNNDNKEFILSMLQGSRKLKEEKIALIDVLKEIKYFSATKFADPSKASSSIELINVRGSSTQPRTAHDKFIRELYDTYKLSSKDGIYKKYLSLVTEHGLSLIQDIDFEKISVPSNTVKVLVGGKYQNKEITRTVIVPRVKIDGLYLSFNQLSEGTFRTLALVFYLLHSKESILLLEEPEVSVHHGLLSSIIELIKIQSKDKQIIISTHSDFVLDKLKPENIILVTKNTSGTKAEPLASSMSDDDYKYLKKYLEETGSLGEFWRVSGFDDE